ncbi:MAG: ABC transporter permease [Erysipelotrichaceae bacterium]
MNKTKNRTLQLSLLAILLGIVVGAVILILTGKNPVDLFIALIRSTTGIYLKNGFQFSPRYIGEFLVSAAPIILTGLSVGFAYRTGMFNIGAEGQVMMGATAAALVGLLLDLPPFIHVVVALLAAAIGGGLWGAIPGYLKSKFHIHEVVVCIMLNYTALYTSNYIIETIDPAAVGVRRTADFASTALLKSPFLSQLTGGSRLNWGIVVAILAVIIYWFIIEKTTFGFSLRATGHNTEGARYAGMKVNRNMVSSMFISGAFAGLAGAIICLGMFGYARILPTFENYGFDGIAVALVGSSSGIGILLSGLLFAMLKNAQQTLQTLGLTKDIVMIISSSIVLFVAMKQGLSGILDFLSKNKIIAKKPSEADSSGGEA